MWVYLIKICLQTTKFIGKLYYHVARRQHDLIRHETNGYHANTFLNSLSLFSVGDSINFSPKNRIFLIMAWPTRSRADSSSLCPIREMLPWRTSKVTLGCPGTSRQCQSASPFILKTTFWITGVNLRTDHIDQKWTNRNSMRSEKRSRSSALLFPLFINLRVNSHQAVVFKLAHDAFNDWVIF